MTAPALPPVDITLVEHLDMLSSSAHSATTFGTMSLVFVALLGAGLDANIVGNSKMSDIHGVRRLGATMSVTMATLGAIAVISMIAAGFFIDDDGDTRDDQTVSAMAHSMISPRSVYASKGRISLGSEDDSDSAVLSDILSADGQSAKVSVPRTDDTTSQCTVTRISRDGDQDLDSLKAWHVNATNTYHLKCP